MLLRDTINEINKKFSGLIDGITTFGLTQLVRRTSGSIEERLPCEIGLDGECKYVGIDDLDKVRIYHRNISITTARTATNSGYGDKLSRIVNTYQMSMVVYMDHKRTKLFPEELFLFLQANFPDALKSEPYDLIIVRIANVILNSQQIFQAEYPGTDFKLPPEKSLFQINYTIETTHKKECFAKCPEDC